MSPAGFASGNSYVWDVNTSGNVYYINVTIAGRLRPVLNLTVDTQISDGDGTKENPFIVE